MATLVKTVKGRWRMRPDKKGTFDEKPNVLDTNVDNLNGNTISCRGKSGGR